MTNTKEKEGGMATKSTNSTTNSNTNTNSTTKPGAGLDFNALFRDWQGNQLYRDLTWSGTFNDYLSLVKSNPRVTRNAFQRIYEMIIEKGTIEYTEFKKKVVRYKFFDDTDNPCDESGAGNESHVVPVDKNRFSATCAEDEAGAKESRTE